MWQRAQSLYLVGVSLVSVLNLFTSLAMFTAGNSWWKISPMGIEPAGLALTWDQYISAGLHGVVLFLAVRVITLYQKRKIQMRLIRLLQAFVIIILGAQYWSVHVTNQLLEFQGYDTSVSYGIGLVLPVISFILLGMSYRGVKKDDDLVKSVDRIR